MKADAWEGGHRVPFIVKWEGKIKKGSVSNVTTTLTNLMATSSQIVSGKNLVKSAMDSYSILPDLLGKENLMPVPQTIINESSHGLFAVRRGPWKLIEGRGSGGFSDPVTYHPKPGEAKGQLYNLETDSSETNNLYLKDPGRVDLLTHLMDSIKKLKH
jgi:arylsulfatase A-like enzyme